MLHLAPDKVLAVHMQGWRRQVARMSHRNVRGMMRNDLRAVLDNAMGLVQELQPRRVQVVLSDHLVRYFSMPWRAECRNPAEELALAHLAFDDTYGANAHQDWEFTFSDEMPGLTRLVAAAPRELMNGLREGLRAAGAKLLSVRPQMAVAVQAFAKQLQPGNWIMCHERGRLSVAGWRADGWHWVSSRRILKEDPDQLLMRLVQELMLGGSWPIPPGSEPVKVYVCTPVLVDHQWSDIGDLQLTPWKLPEGLMIRLRVDEAQSAYVDDLHHEYIQALLGVLI
jgi:hypothetical protein